MTANSRRHAYAFAVDHYDMTHLSSLLGQGATWSAWGDKTTMPSRQLWAIFALYALLAIAALWRYQIFPSFAPGTDAWNYIEYGQIWFLL
jgi:hypothetical protein